MTYSTYIHITDDFVEGLKRYIRHANVSLAEIVEVFAGNGALATRLGLPDHRNYSDNLLFVNDGYDDEVNELWDRKPPGVVVETAYETILRFGAEEGHTIRLLIMGAPLPAHSNFCPTYEAAKALHYLFDARMLYIGERPSAAFASPKFFKHTIEAEDETFDQFVLANYDGSGGYFASDNFETPVKVQPYLLKFVPCNDPNCDCRDDSRIRRDLEARYRQGVVEGGV